jgi:ATP-dependent protease ClpP protease subunit
VLIEKGFSMYCTQCGAENQPTAKFCFSCGGAIITSLNKNLSSKDVILPQQQTGEDEEAGEKVFSERKSKAATTLPDPIPVVETHKSANFIFRHWRGDFSLAVSYWVIYILLSMVLTGAATALFLSEFWHSLSINTTLILLVLYFCLVIPITLWQIIGTFRSAGMHVSRGGRRGWATTAQILLVLGFLRLCMELLETGFPMMKASLDMLSNGNDISSYELRVLRQGKEVELSGGMSEGTAKAIANILDATPTIKIIHLNTNGGLIKEGLDLASLIQKKGLLTYTATQCSSACTIAFISGKERYLSKNGSIGFHSASFGTLDGTSHEELNSHFVTALRKRGIQKEFINKALSTPSQEMWYPTHTELKQANVIDEIVDPMEFGYSGLTNWRDHYKNSQNLLSSPIYKAVQQYDPQLYVKIQKAVESSLENGDSLLEMKRNIREILFQAIQSRYLAFAPDLALIPYWNSQINEMEYITKQNPYGCLGLLFPDQVEQVVDLHSILPQELIDDDVSSLIDLIKGAQNYPVYTNSPDQVEEDLDRVMVSLLSRNEDYLKVVSEPDKYFSNPALLCDSFIALYRSILELPVNRSGPILRTFMNDD